MAEFWDVYDKDRNKTGKLTQRGVDKLKEGEYHIVVTAVILNSKNEILITQRAEFKTYPLMWECNGGSALKDETSRILAVMFKTHASKIKFKPVDGMKVLVKGKISVYEATGTYQIYVEEMQVDGIGNLYLEYEKLKKKLEIWLKIRIK